MFVVASVRHDKGVVRRVAGAKVAVKTARLIEIHSAFGRICANLLTARRSLQLNDIV